MIRRLVTLIPLQSGSSVQQSMEVEPAAEDIAAWLDAHPDEQPAVRAAMRVIHRWHATGGCTWLAHPLDLVTLGSAMFDPEGDEDPTPWSWSAGAGDGREKGRCASKGLALDEIRRVLRACGWTVPS